MKTRIGIKIILIAFLLCISMLGCKDAEKPKPAENTKPVETPQIMEPFKIGAPLPLTGDGADYGKTAQKAIDLAVEEINAQGGVNGRKLKVFYQDTKLLSTETVNAVTKLITQDHVEVIVGPMDSDSVHPIIPIAEKNNIIVVSPSATDHALSGISKNFFRTIVSDVYDGKAMAEFAFQRMGYRKVGTLAIDSAGPLGVTTTFQDVFKSLGGEISVSEHGPQSGTNFRAQLTKLKNSKIDAVFFAGFKKETGIILKQAKELGLKKQFLTHQLGEDPEVREIAGDAANGLIFSTPKLDPSTGSPAVKTFYDKFKGKYGEEPGNFASNSYDAVKMIALAISKRGFTTDELRTGLLEIKDYDGASGIMTFDEKGDVIQNMRIMFIDKGNIKSYQ